MPGREDIFQKSMNEGHSAAWDQEWGKAATAYRKALQEMPDNPKALNSLGLALFQQGGGFPQQGVPANVLRARSAKVLVIAMV